MTLPMAVLLTSPRASARTSRVHSPLTENGEQDAFAVADLLREDTGPGTGLARAAAPLVGEAFGLGGLPGGEPPCEFVQFVFGESGQYRVG